MRVGGQHERRPALGQRGDDVGRMRHDHGCAGQIVRARERRARIGMAAERIVDADDRQRSALDGAIRDHGDSGAAQRRHDRARCGPMVVVTQHGDGAERCVQACQRCREQAGVARAVPAVMTGNEITGDQHEIWTACVYLSHDPGEAVGVRRSAADMDVAEQRHRHRRGALRPVGQRDRGGPYQRVAARLAIPGRRDPCDREHHAGQGTRQVSRAPLHRRMLAGA